MTGAAVIWYKIYFVCPLIKEGSKITKQNRKNVSLWKPTGFTTCWVSARNKCDKSEIYVVLAIPVISDFLGHPEDEDQQALYPVITASHH